MYNILVIDDDEPIRVILENLLSSEFNVFLAEDAQMAIDLLSENSVNLIVSDIYMPGMNGIQLLESLRVDEVKKHIPVLIMTNLPSQEKKDLAKDLGAADFIEKTILFRDKDSFLDRVRIKILTDVRIPDLNEQLTQKKGEIISRLMKEAVFGTFESITNVLCQELNNLFEVDYCSFWTINEGIVELSNSFKQPHLDDPIYSSKYLMHELFFQKVLNNKESYFSNYVYNGEAGIMNKYSIQNKLPAEIGIPLFSINEKTLLLNHMQIPDDASIFAFLNIKRKKLFSTQEYDLLKNLITQMGPAFWRLYKNK